MEQNQPQQNDQQATNAALAALAAAGNSFALGQLWEINKGLLHQLFWKWYAQNKTVADSHGITMEDFDQETFFAVRDAAQTYDPAKGSFSTHLSYHVQSHIRRTLCGGHTRLITDQDGRKVQVSANPLDECASLDVRLDSEDEGSSTRGEIIPDPAAAQAFRQAEDEIYTGELHNALETAMTQNLTERQAHILRRRYYDGQSLQAVGDELGVQGETVRQIERRSIRILQNLPELQRWREDVITTRAWHGTGWSAWNHSGSVQERTVEYLEQRESERYLAFLEQAAQLAPEHRAAIEKLKAGYLAQLDESRESVARQLESIAAKP